jgi:predicted phosphate transport protein (TIGR00153 family)
MPSLIPKDERFLDAFVEDGENLLAAARALAAMLSSYDRLDERVAEIQRLEKRGDEIDLAIAERLEKAFVTPFDREDIHELAVQLDDVVDGIQEIAETCVIYGIESITAEGRQLGEILAKQAEHLAAALAALKDFKGIGAHLQAIHELEHQADGISRAAIARLFREETNAITVIKWRDVYNVLEKSIDGCEDACEAIERMWHKAG